MLRISLIFFDDLFEIETLKVLKSTARTFRVDVVQFVNLSFVSGCAFVAYFCLCHQFERDKKNTKI